LNYPSVRSSISRLSSLRIASIFALVGLFLFAFAALAQQAAPAAPATAAQAAPSQAPSAPAPAAALVFPKPNPANFTASSPTKETVDAFLQANWGFDDSRLWQVQAILKTQVEGISKVLILVGDKTGKLKPSVIVFFVLPGEKYIFASDDIVPFGEHPFAENHAILQARADGPYRGAASKDLEIVEFADFQCPHCKEAQPNMDKLAVDFPKARFIYQSLPLPQHTAAMGAAEYGVCVNKLGGSDAFFTFAAAVYDGQDGLATADGATLTLNSAVTKAGLDPAKISACASTPETRAVVDSSVKLALDMKISQTPTLFINGRPVSPGVPYETLKQMVQYQAKADGVAK
jgi:protein-disulfide isomerase